MRANSTYFKLLLGFWLLFVVQIPQAVHASGTNVQLSWLESSPKIVWDAESKGITVTNRENEARVAFTFTNVSSTNVTIMAVNPSCGCTTVQLPPLPWTIPPGTNGTIGITVNLAGRSGTLVKTITVNTDAGDMTLSLKINIQPPPLAAPPGSNQPPSQVMADADRAHSLELAKADRQAVFKGNCASCHLPDVSNKYGRPLYDAVCGICHDSPHRASGVPDLYSLRQATGQEFWRKWIAEGKPGILMPGFAASEGGPLTGVQIGTLASYLNTAIPSHR